MPTAEHSTAPTVMLLSLPEASVILKPLPVMVPVSIESLRDVECPPLMTLQSMTASIVSAPVVVMAAFPVMLPEYQLPVADTAADDESARMPTSELLVPILPSVMVPVPDVRADVGGQDQG